MVFAGRLPQREAETGPDRLQVLVDGPDQVSPDLDRYFMAFPVKGGDKVFHCGGGIVYHRHDGKEPNWEPGWVRSGAGVADPE